MPTTARRLDLRSELVTALGILVAVGMLGISALAIWRVRADAWAEATARAKQTAFALQQDLGRSLETFDRVLLGVRQHLPHADAAGADPLIRRIVLFDRAKNTSHLGSVIVIDTTGTAIEDSRSPVPRANNLAEHEGFRAHREQIGLGLHISAPFRPVSDNRRWALALARRIDDADGGFAGIVMGVLELDFLARLFAGMTIGPGGTVTLLRNDGIVLMRAPVVPDLIGRSIAGTEMFARIQVANGEPKRGRSPLDGVERLVTTVPVPGVPLLLNVTLSVADIRATWLPRATEIGGAASALTAALLLAILLFRRELALRQEAEAAVRRSEADFRLLAEHSSDIVTRFGPDGTRRYVSPASSQVLGVPPAALLGRSPEADLHPDDVGIFADGLRRLASGTKPSLTLTYRLRHAAGDWIWIEATLTAVRDPMTGAPDGVVAVSRDVTERKQMENDLVRLASQDALTGLANRRTLDATLAREWLRAARAQLPLSVLLLDIDHFKSFNDTYGHPEGDACLRRVAGAVARTTRRASDLAARYGGEEFFVLLAETDAAGAAAVAERLREEVVALRIEHGASGAGAVVTVSIGLATVVPSPQDVGGRAAGAVAALVQQADAALYAAKRGGRNRVVAAASVAALA